MKKVGLVMILACLLSMPVLAQSVPDFQLIMNGLQAKLNTLTLNSWTSSVYTNVVGPTYTPPFNQSSPSFVGTTNIENGIKDDDHLALFQKVLENDACVRELLGGTFVDNVRAQFFANQAHVVEREAYFDLELLNATRINLDYTISISDKSAWTGRTRLNTNAANNLRLCVGTGIFIVGDTCLDQAVDIPSIWTKDADGDGTLDDGLLDAVSPGLSNDLRDLMAAYLTMGQQGMVDYMQAVIFQAFYRGLMPNIMELVLTLIKGVPADPEIIPYVPDWNFDVSSKAYTPTTAISNVSIDKSYNPALRICLGGDPPCSSQYVELRRVVAVVYGDSIDNGVLKQWLNYYTVGGNGFGTGFSNRFAATGDLKLDGTTNYADYVTAGFNRANWLVQAGAGIQFNFSDQPDPPAGPIDYGAQHYMSAVAAGGSGGPIGYQWYSGTSPSLLAPVAGQTTNTYNPIIDFYSYGSDVQKRYYRVVASTTACSSTIQLNSTTIEVVGGAPPAITVYDNPVGGMYFPGQSLTLTTNAGVAAGTLFYQWQKYDAGAAAFVNLPGKTAKQLAFPSLTLADIGTYRCQVLNQVGGKDDKANPVYWVYTTEATVDVAPTIAIDPQPVGSELAIGDNYTLTCGASVASGSLEYKWQKNSGLGYVDLTGWVSAGGTSFSATWNIVSATLSSSGTYRLQVRNTLAPFGTYAVNSATAAINVTSGNVFYVDPTGNNTDGESWATAFWTLQDAIDAAAAAPGGTGGEVWVAGGTPASPIIYNEPRTIAWGGAVGDPGRVVGSLIMRSNVGVYGGFEGYRGGAGAQEDNRLQRNRAQNIAVIDGSVARGGNFAFHTIIFGGVNAVTSNSTLDGFVVTGGNAAGTAGVYHTWRGGGILNYGSTPTIANCIITGNHAETSGGGIANERSNLGPGDANIMNCLFYDNSADRQADGLIGPDGGNPIRGGGAIFNNLSAPTMNMVTVVENAVDNTYFYPPATPGSVPHNWGQNSAGIYSWNGTPLVTNAIVWDNVPGGIRHDKPGTVPVQDTTVTYTDVQGGYAGVGNLNTDPLLGNAAYVSLIGNTGYYVPAVGSPVINQGDPSITGGDDLFGVIRPLAGGIDMGAFEVSTSGPTPACLPYALDFVVTPQITDPFELYDAEASTSEAPIWSVEVENKTFGCADIPTSSILLTATDILGRTGTCTATVTVTESLPPTPVCNNISVELDGTGNYALTPADLAALSAGSSDNCTPSGSLIVSALPNSFTCAQAGQAVNVTVTVEDGQGNSASCTAQVTVNDNVDPVPPSPANSISVDLLPNGTYTLSSANLQTLAAGTTDNCSVDLPATTADPSAFTCADLGPNTIDLTVRDTNGNSAVGSAEVIVNDVTAPNLLGVTPRSFVSASGDYQETAALSGVGATDTCEDDLSSSVTVAVFDQDLNPVPFPIPANWDMGTEVMYEFSMVYTVQDTSGNSASETTTLTLFALLLPEITLNGDDPATVECPGPYSDAGATAFDPESSSDITGSMSTVVDVNAALPGVYTVTYSVPVPGYPSLPPVVETRTVNVIDTTAPVLALTSDNPLFWQRGVAFTEPVTAFDACEGDLTAQIVVGGDPFDANTSPLGSYNRTYDVEDAQGNAAPTLPLTVVLGDLLNITLDPVGTRLYTNSPDYVMTAAYENGFNVAGYEWFLDGAGLGFVAATTVPNTVSLTVDPGTLTPGIHEYYLSVSDDSGETLSATAEIEVANPLTSTPLANLSLMEAETDTWKITVSGGLGAIQYQWFAKRAGETGFTPVTDGPFGVGAYDGATTNMLKLTPFTSTMAGQYYVEVSDDLSTITVGPANLTLDVGVPAVGLLGLIALAAATALGGATTLRKRK